MKHICVMLCVGKHKFRKAEKNIEPRHTESVTLNRNNRTIQILFGLDCGRFVLVGFQPPGMNWGGWMCLVRLEGHVTLLFMKALRH